MESDPTNSALVDDLRSLGRSARTIESDSATTDFVDSVMSRLAELPQPRTANRWQRLRQRAGEAFARRRRRVLVLATVILLGCLGVPGVRASVVDWFTFDGISVHIRPTPDGTATQAPPPPTAGGTSLNRARTLIDFRPVVLTALGDPPGVEVSADRRMLSLTWDRSGGTIRLDQFDGTVDYAFAKTAPAVEWTNVAGVNALWFEEPHEVVILDAAGNRRTETARLAGHTLIWDHDGTALRLEGNFTREQAVEIAESARSLP